MENPISLIIVLLVIAGIGYGLWRFKLGPFKPKTVTKAPMQRKGKDPTPRTPPPVEPAPTEPPPAP